MEGPKKGRRRRPPSPPGGRALERLHQFEQERGLEPTPLTPADARDCGREEPKQDRERPA